MSSSAATAGEPAAAAEWTTVFQDDFDGAAGTGLNRNDWLYDMGTNVATGGSYPNKVCGCASPAADTTSGVGMSVDWFSVKVSQ
ncbi:hypothetical protein JBE04_02920 [Streptomyces sp. PRKS01-29]|nr:hypothetical protein [Streptomyces sabulosicollis]MBI0293468.1 hypothetical protein [Streptomyces sabulosicollis]